MATLPEDCCGGGACCPCIWDVYYEKLDKWREAKKAQEESQQQPSDTSQLDKGE